MGRTLPSVTQVFYMQEASLSRFRRTLRPIDRHALDQLLTSAQHHLSAAAYAAHTLPMEIFLLAMILEQHKAIKRLKVELPQPKKPPE